MAPKKSIEVNTDKKNDKKTTNNTTKKQNNGSSKMKKSGGVVASTAARPTTAATLGRPTTAATLGRPTTAAASARPLSNRLLSTAAIPTTNRLLSARPLSTAASTAASTTASTAASDRPTTVGPGTNRPPSTKSFTATNEIQNSDPPLPPGRGTDISFDFYCDKDEMTKNMCKDGSDLEATSSRLQQIIQQVINELLTAPDALPPLNILMTQILVSFVVDMIQNALQKEQKINPTDKNIDNLFKMASNIVLTSFVTTGQVPSASTIVIRVLVKRSMLDQKNAPSIPAMGKKLTLETIKEAQTLLNKLDVFELRMKEIIKNNNQQSSALNMQGIGGSRPKTRTGGRKSRRGN